MRKVVLLISIIALLIIPIGCVDVDAIIKAQVESALAGLRATYTIEVSGTAGLNFSGRYIVVRATYHPQTRVAFSSASHDISNQPVPQQYIVTDAILVGAMFQKLSVGNETLEVKIWRGPVGSVLVDSANTTLPFGAVLVGAIRQG